MHYLHTRDARRADSEELAAMIRSAKAVFIPGGRTMFLQVYRGTAVEREIRALLARGGVLAGNSAGAVALSCCLLTWLPTPFGSLADQLSALPRVAVSAHVNKARGFVVDSEVVKYVQAHPQTVGIDVDENTMLIMRGPMAEIVGTGYATFIDMARDRDRPYLRMGPGSRRDLSQPTNAQTSLTTRLDSLVRTMAGSQTVGLSVAVLRGPDTLLLRGYGLADREDKRPATPATVYRIASLTKQMTASAVMRLVEQRKLALEDDIGQYVPAFPLHGNHVTVHQLLNHTAGVHNFTDGTDRNAARFDAPADTVLRWIAAKPFDFAPGSAMAYSNTGYTLLGLIIEKVSGNTYADFIQREFFAPLGLTHTRYCDSHSTDPAMAAGYSQRSALAHTPDVNMHIPFAAGAICSTAADFAAWERAFVAGKVVSPASVRRMTTPDTLPNGTVLDYGFGLGVGRLGAYSAFTHGGSITGFSSAQVVLPSESVVVVVFTNTEGYRPEPLAFDLARLVVGYATNGFGALDRPGHISGH